MVEGVRLDGGGGEVGMDLWLEMLEWAISTDSLIFLTKRHMERQIHAYCNSSLHPLPPTLSQGVVVVR